MAIYLISDGIGGAEQVVWQTIYGLKRYDSIFLIVNNEIASSYANLLPINRFLNIGDIFIHSKKRFRILRQIFKNRFYSYIPFIIRSRSKKIVNYLNDNKIDIIHSHLDYAQYSSFQIKKIKKNIRIFHTVHSAFGLIENKHLKPFIQFSKLDFSSIDKLIFVSNYVHDLYEANGIPTRGSEIVYNGIDYTETIQFSRSRKTNKKFEILYVGGSKYVKGFDILIEIISSLHKLTSDNSFHVVVLGQISNNSEFVKLIRQSDLDQYFSLIGFIPPPLHLKYFKSADMIIMPSRSEALPIAVIESIFLDLPVIASNAGGIPEIIKHGENGYLVNNNTLEYSDYILKLMNNYDSFLVNAQNYNMKIKPLFSANIMYKKLMEIYS